MYRKIATFLGIFSTSDWGAVKFIPLYLRIFPVLQPPFDSSVKELGSGLSPHLFLLPEPKSYDSWKDQNDRRSRLPLTSWNVPTGTRPSLIWCTKDFSGRRDFWNMIEMIWRRLLSLVIRILILLLIFLLPNTWMDVFKNERGWGGYESLRMSVTFRINFFSNTYFVQ